MPVKKAWITILRTILLGLAVAILHTSSFGEANLPDAFQKMDSLEMGKHLFFRTVMNGDTARSCADCHLTVKVDTFSWMPSAYDLAIKFQTKDEFELAEAIFFPLTDKSWESHEEVAIDAGDVTFIKIYLEDLYVNGLEKPRTSNDKSNLIFASIVLLIFLVLDRLTIRFVKPGIIYWAGMAACLGIVSFIGYNDAVALGLQQDYQPPQPVKFSHKVHAGQNKTDCLYCHMPARYGPSAGIPGQDLCFNCHASVVEGKNSGGFEIAKLYDHKEAGMTVSWIRVNNLPDHVFFSHVAHYEVARIDCGICHGKVEEENRMRQPVALSMRWCIDCHDTTYVKVATNDYYSSMKGFSLGLPDSLTARELGGWDCSTCHY